MNSFLGLENIPAHVDSSLGLDHPTPPRLLLELEPWASSFYRNLADLFRRRTLPAVKISSPPGTFWPDVFVTRRLPWFAFAESLLYHGIFLVLAWSFSTLVAMQPRTVQTRRFDPTDVIYYSPSEYLPPLDTGAAQASKAQKGEPEFAKQPILSVPPEADNPHQTIVTPPDIKLTHDVQTPNVIAWGNHSVPVPAAAVERVSPRLAPLPGQIVAPAPEVYESADRKLSSLAQSVIAPPPQASAQGVRAVASMSIDVIAPAPDGTVAGTRRTVKGPEAAIVGPPPAVNAASIRKLGDINIGRSEVIAPAPQLGVEAQRTVSPLGAGGKSVVPPPPSVDASETASVRGRSGNARGQSGMGEAGGQVVPPPPSLATSSEGSGRLIALGLHPSIAPPSEPPQGNRRGTFAAGPEGKTGAAGTPEIRASNDGGTDGHGIGTDGVHPGSGSNSKPVSGAPPGLHVGAGAGTNGTAGDTGNGGTNGSAKAQKTEIASASLPSNAVGASPRPKAELVENPSPLDRQVFHDRRLYSMRLNKPNLNSAGGSWVMRFAELDSNQQAGELIAPVADHMVDPAYPMQLMRENVAGTVTLRAIIGADGSVRDIKVVNGADARLDRFASDALARWHFHPAMKNDANVDVEAIVIIPFKPALKRSAF